MTNSNDENRAIHTDKMIDATLRMLGLSQSYKGFNYLIYAVNLVLEDPEMLAYICKDLYSELAIYYKTSINCAERNIRTAKEVIWHNSNADALRSVFGDQYDLKVPRNAVFIDRLAYYVRSLMEQ